MYFRILSYQVFFDTVQTSSQMVFIGKKLTDRMLLGRVLMSRMLVSMAIMGIVL